MMNKRWIVGLLRKGFRSVGLEVQWLRSANTEEAILTNLLGQIRPALVMDVGANVGQYALGLRRLGYRGRILSFEALPSVHANLIRVADGDPHWDVAPCAALGARGDLTSMNVSGNKVSSSLLGMNSTYVHAAPESAYVGTEAVQVMRLDDPSIDALLPEQGSLFLKIDTQGYEKWVLEGAVGVLPRVDVIQVELSLVEIYKGAPRIAEMISCIECLGFEMFNLAPGFKDSNAGRLLQADGFFVRSGRL